MSDSSAEQQLLNDLAEEFADRQRRGERPSLGEYTDRYPHLAEQIRDLFPALAMMEEVKEEREAVSEPAAAGPLPALVRLGDYRIIREIGRGGMGVVYEAEQVSLGRHVALKVLPPQLLVDARTRQRFEREARAAARLHHTNIVPVFGVGEHEGIPYYAMQFIPGLPLDAVLDELKRLPGSGALAGPVPASGVATSPRDLSAVEAARSLLSGQFQAAPAPTVDESPAAVVAAAGPARLSDTVERSSSSLVLPGQSADAALSSTGKRTYWCSVANLGVQLANALEYAHKQGVIHRDLKPSNLLLAPTGRLSLTDFGLARVLEQPGMTLSGEFVGTPAYMSPEQITAGRIPLDHRTDIYSLGATLYELLTLEPPHQGKSREQVLAEIVQKEPKPPRRVQKMVPLDLETICLKCLEKDPDRRYQTAGELAEDLRRYVNRFAILARRAGPVQRLVKWVRRRPAVAASLGCMFLTVCVAVAFVYQAHRVEQLRLRQLLDEKISSAYLFASSGDTKKTERAIKEIEELGGSTGQVRLLRGVVAYFGQDLEGAINELEQAVKLLPESVAARALLAISYTDAGQDDKYERCILEMARLSPSSAEDKLFKGYAREVNELGGPGLPDLDAGIQQHDSPLGRALRAFARANRAIDSGQRRDAEAALDDANAARGMLPDNPLALYVSLYARVVAAGIYQEAKLTQERTVVLQEAARVVQALERFVELPNPVFARWLYFQELGDDSKALEVVRRSFDRSANALAAFYSAASLYQHGSFAEGLKLLSQRRQPDFGGDVMRIFLLAELPEGRRRALDECKKLDKAYPQDGWQMRTKGELFLFLGEKEQALASLRTVRSPLTLSQDWTGFYEAMRQFDRGQLSEEAFLAKAGASRWKQFHVHYQLGLLRLADGDRSAAREHFQKAVGTRAVWIYPWAWSKMFLSRMEKDDKWPQWIPGKESRPKPP